MTSKGIASYVFQNEGKGAPQSLLLAGLIERPPGLHGRDLMRRRVHLPVLGTLSAGHFGVGLVTVLPHWNRRSENVASNECIAAIR